MRVISDFGYHSYNYDPPTPGCEISRLKRKKSSIDLGKIVNSQEKIKGKDPTQGILQGLEDEDKDETNTGYETYSNKTLLEIVRRA